MKTLTQFTVLVCLVSSLAVAEPGVISVSGEIPKSGTLTQSDLEKLGPVTVTWKLEKNKHKVTGVPLDVLLKHLGFDAGPMSHDTPKAEKRSGYRKVVVATATDGFKAVFTTAELVPEVGATRAYVIWKIDGKALPESEGKFRLAVITDKEPSRSIYQLESLYVTVPKVTN
jgi:hypothetical protein